MLILLVNGWVDYANASLRDVRINLYTHSHLMEDDYDTLYEWVAESLFDVNEAIPEQEGDSDDTGKISPAKIVIASCTSMIHDFAIPPLNGVFYPSKHLRIPLPVELSIWVPPPNA
jgi:hypothetical protein